MESKTAFGFGRKLRKDAFLASAYPLAFMLCLHAAWVAAWLELGHPPRPSLDDPKDLGMGVLVFFIATWLLILGTPLGAMVSALVLIGAIIRRATESPVRANQIVTLIGVTAGSWFLAFAIFYGRCSEVFEWFAD
jgi:hypothetical protein